jgi:hypothetical protein
MQHQQQQQQKQKQQWQGSPAYVLVAGRQEASGSASGLCMWDGTAAAAGKGELHVC